MVGYGDSLFKARRPGWDSAYLDYATLKSMLEEVEKLYKACEESAAGISTAREGEEEALLEDGLYSGANEFYRESLEVLAHQHSEHFLRTLRKQVEKVSLFALSRQGELADAVGSLRFNPYLDGSEKEESPIKRMSSNLSTTENLTIRHDSKAKGGYGSISMHSDSSDDNDIANNVLSDELSFLLPQISHQTRRNMNGSIPRPRESLETSPRPMFSGRAVFKPKYRGFEESQHLDEPLETGERLGPDPDSVVGSSPLDPYTAVGVELLHLLRYVCINAVGVRKILKKYDKTIEGYSFDSANPEFYNVKLRNELNNMSPFLSAFVNKAENGPDDHLNQLTNSDSIAAIASSLLKASIKAGSINTSMEQYLIHDEGLLRFKCAIDCIDILREYANIVNKAFPAFLSRRAMTVTGYDLGGMEGMKQKALEVLLTFDPDTILLMDKPDLSEWQQRCWQYTFTPAGNKMRMTTFDMIDDGGTAKKEKTLAWGGVDGKSMIINLMSSVLYTINYYIVAPTANSYAIHLGRPGALGGALIGASSFSALFGALIYSVWFNKFSFKSALIFSSLCPICGNIAYVVALSFRSMKVALLGRVLVGLGSAEVVNRQLISACVHFNYMTSASAAFVVTSAAGMSIGPLLAAVLDFFAGRDFDIDYEIPHLGGIIFDHVSSPAILMTFLWMIQLTALIFSFTEPFQINVYTDDRKRKKQGRPSFISEIKEIFGLVFSNPALPLTLLLFGCVEMICEVLISSCAIVFRQYFSWTGSAAGFFIASLAMLLLPAHFFVERASRGISERSILKNSAIFIMMSIAVVINYDTLFYEIGVVSTKVEHEAVGTWHTVENTSIKDWNIVKDPQTWNNLRNETEREWEHIENITDQEWVIFQNETTHVWGKLKEEGSSEFQKLSEEAKLEYKHLENSTEEEWMELRKDAKYEWKNLVNESEIEWEKLQNAAVEEWKELPNQTVEEWGKVNNGARRGWKHLSNETSVSWRKTSDNTKSWWGKAGKAIHKNFQKAKESISEGWSKLFESKTRSNDGMHDNKSNKSGLQRKLADALGGTSVTSLHTIDSTNEATASVQKYGQFFFNIKRKKTLQPYDWGYGSYAYLIGVACIFTGTIVLEGADTSLMCKTAPSILNSKFINVGLLATVVGTIGRMLGDALITASGYCQNCDFINFVFIPLVPLMICIFVLVRRFYWSLI